MLIKKCLDNNELGLRQGYVPDKGNLILIHPWLQGKTGVFSKGWDNKTEDQCDAHKYSRQNNLYNTQQYYL